MKPPKKPIVWERWYPKPRRQVSDYDEGGGQVARVMHEPIEGRPNAYHVRRMVTHGDYCEVFVCDWTIPVRPAVGGTRVLNLKLFPLPKPDLEEHM